MAPRLPRRTIVRAYLAAVVLLAFTAFATVVMQQLMDMSSGAAAAVGIGGVLSTVALMGISLPLSALAMPFAAWSLMHGVNIGLFATYFFLCGICNAFILWKKWATGPQEDRKTEALS